MKANSWTIRGGRVLRDNSFALGDLTIRDGIVSKQAERGRTIDASGLVVLPGIVDIHGDAFERQLAPRPGVLFDMAIALSDTDRQVVANGITTVLHGLTWSWEPGLRGVENAIALVDTVERLKPELGARTLVHLRHETFNLDAVPVILDWIARRRLAVVAFNDHLTGLESTNRAKKIDEMAKRAGLTNSQFEALIERTWARRAEVVDHNARLASAAMSAGIALLSHDDRSPEQRDVYRRIGCRIAEFPVNVATAEAAARAGDHIVFGAPNVVRGGSHIGCPSASEMIAGRLCTILASDYYYPALIAAPFRLAAESILPLERAWSLVSKNPAAALRLPGGTLRAGAPADVILVDQYDPLRPKVIATMIGGRVVFCCEGERLAN